MRVAYTLLVAKDTSGIGDFFFYHGQANLLAEGKGFIHPLLLLDGITVPSAEHPPLWPVVLSVTSSSEAPASSHRVTGCLIGAVADRDRRPARPPGRASGPACSPRIAAAYPTLIAADGLLMSETSTACWWEPGCSPPSACLTGLPMALALGALIGLAALTRAEALLFLALLALPVCLLGKPRRRAGGCRWRPAPLL